MEPIAENIVIKTKATQVPIAKPGMPFADTRIAQLLTRRIDELASRKNQREIAAELGYSKPNVISMMKRGEMKVPLDKIPALADALELDAGHLFRLALEQSWPERTRMITKMFGHVVTDNEMAIIKEVRKASGESDPALTRETAVKLREIFKK